MRSDIKYWIGFNHIQGIGAARVQKLLAAFGNLERAWHADLAALAASGLDERSVRSIAKERDRLRPGDLLDQSVQAGIRIYTFLDEAYPRRLKEIPLPPPVLYVRGTLLAVDDLSVAMVGTRRATTYGKTAARFFAEGFAAHGITVVSGLARGVDAEAHTAALDCGGRTLAVLGCGVDCVYPPEHTRLADRIIASGALISDYPPGTPPDAANFPPRNRLIAGLALATVVVEAGDPSGAILTAKYAGDYGRDVFAVPGSIFSPAHRGCHRLLVDGVAPALSPMDVLASLDIERSDQLSQARMALPEGPIESKILQALDVEPKHIDIIRAQTGLPIREVSATLALMELKGMVRQVSGMQYALLR
jgi:DNA processing protein